MLINSKNISTFGCSLVKYEVGSSELQKSVEWAKGSLSPLVAFDCNKFKDLTITLLLQGSSREQVETYKSNLAKELKKAKIKFTDSKFYYDGTLEGMTFTNINRLALEVEINFKALQQEGLKTINLARNASQSVTIEGNAATEVIIEITAPSAGVASFKINDITIKNITGGQTVVIDGIKKTITMNGKNKFADSDIWAFPVLKAGSNTITMNLTTVDVKIKYYPCWE